MESDLSKAAPAMLLKSLSAIGDFQESFQEFNKNSFQYKKRHSAVVSLACTGPLCNNCPTLQYLLQFVLKVAGLCIPVRPFDTTYPTLLNKKSAPLCNINYTAL